MTGPNLLDAGPAPAPDDTDYSAELSPDVIRTIVGEGDPAYVASVLRNRHKKSGINYETLINDPNQFEARTGDSWKQLSQIPEDDPRYIKALQTAGPILLGKADPVTEADSFYSPAVLKARNKAAPTWDDGTGSKGPDGQLYFTDKYVAPVRPNLMDAAVNPDSPDTPAPEPLAVPPPTPPGVAHIEGRNGRIVFSDTKEPLPSDQEASVRALIASGNIDPTKSPGDSMFPHIQRDPRAAIAPGQFYIDAKGNMHKVPGGPADDTSALGNFGEGLYAGAGDVPLSVMKLLPGHKDSDLYNSFMGNQLEYNAHHEGSKMAQAGRFTGQLLTTAPVTGVTGGLGSLPIMVKGALEGGQLAALTSGASNEPVSRQVLEGAATGAVAAPVLRGIGSAITSKMYPQISENISNLADKAVNKFGIDLRAPQIQGAVDQGAAEADRRLLKAPGSGFARNAAQQPLQFTKAVGTTFGVDPREITSNGLTPQIMSDAKARIGNVMNSYAANQQVEGAPLADMLSKLDTVKSDLRLALQKDQADPLVENIYRIIRQTKDGAYTGERYKDMIANGQPFDRLQNSSDSTVKYYAGKVRDILDDAFEQSYNPAKGGTPLETFREARTHYKNLMTTAGAVDSNGHINPTALDNEVDKRFKSRAFSGAGDLGDLADIGQLFMRNNGQATSHGPLVPAALGGALGTLFAGGEGAAAYMHDPILAGKIAGGTAALLGGRYVGNAVRGATANNAFLRDRLLEHAQYDPNALTLRLGKVFSTPPVTLATVNALQQPQGNR